MKSNNNQILGIFAILGAPFLFVELYLHGQNGAGASFEHTWLGGVFGIFYITGWMCSILGLKLAGAYGNSRFANSLFYLQILFLVLANCWNVYEAVKPGADTFLYALLDAFWPLSNVLMLVTGITLVVANRLEGWKRFVPLIVGLWFPLTVIPTMLSGQTYPLLIYTGIYSTLAWMLLGVVVFGSSSKAQVSGKRAIKMVSAN